MTLKEKVQSVLDKFNVKLSVQEPEPVKMMAEGKLIDGTVVASPADEFAVGVEIFVMDADGNPTPAPDGEHTLEDGTVVVVAEGKIAEIKVKEAEVEMSSEVTAIIEELGQRISALEGALASKSTELEAATANLRKVEVELTAAKAQVTQLSKAPATKSVKEKNAVELAAAEKATSKDLYKKPVKDRVLDLMPKK